MNNSLTGVLLNSISKGEGVPATMLAIENSFAPYNADGNTIKPNGEILKPYRTEAIARTATLGSYNFGL